MISAATINRVLDDHCFRIFFTLAFFFTRHPPKVTFHLLNYDLIEWLSGWQILIELW